MENFEKLDPDKIKAGLKTHLPCPEILVYQQTKSTNDIASRCAGTPAAKGLCVFAEHQTAGRGRAANKWQSLPFQSLLCSSVLHDWPGSSEILALSAAAATALAIDKHVPAFTQIKWPNDILINSKKVAGILIESPAGADRNCRIIGIGINCHQDSAFFTGDNFQYQATSIDIESKGTTDRNALAADLINSLGEQLLAAQKDFHNVLAIWNSKSCLLGRHITLISDNRTYSGHCTGIDPVRGLILHLDAGPVKMFHARNTTIAKQQ